jgi:hypothetical protein
MTPEQERLLFDGLLAGQAPGGWVAVGTDDYARASDGVSPCLRQPRVWLLYVEATGRDGQVRRGQSDPTADYPLGMATAIQRLLESLGVRVTIMDAR